MNNDILLSLRSVSKSFFGNEVLSEVSLDLMKGEVLSLVGMNGAGKSTLSSIVAGIHIPDSGEIEIMGVKRTLRNPRDAEKYGISMVHQEPALVEQLTVAENLFLNREKSSRFGVLNLPEMVEASRSILTELSCKVDPRAVVRDLPLVEKTVIAIARAMLSAPQILILDEVTATFNAAEVEHLFGVIRSVRNQGVGIIFIEHNLAEVVEISDRVAVLRDGQLASVLSSGPNLSESKIIGLMLGHYKRTEIDLSRHSERLVIVDGVEPLLETSQLSVGGIFEDVSIKLSPGEILGIAGLKGAGVTEFLFTLFGALRATRGQVIRRGKVAAIRNPRQAIELGIGMITNDRQKEGLALGLSVAENASIASVQVLSGLFGQANRKRLLALAKKFIKTLDIKTTGPNEPTQFLSGGNQQKVVISKWLARDVEVLLIDEPTRGVDVRAKKEIYDLLLDERDRGKGIIIHSPEIHELLSLANRILVFHRGTVVAELSRRDEGFSESNLLHIIHSGESMSTPKNSDSGEMS